MADGSGVTLKGGEQFERSYNAAMRNIERLPVDQGARMLQGTVKQFAPVRTGALRSSVAVQHRSGGGSVVAVGARYGLYVEYGTRRMRGRRFVQRAMEARQGDIVAAVGTDVQRELGTIRGV